jgi:hypothetical protein
MDREGFVSTACRPQVTLIAALIIAGSTLAAGQAALELNGSPSRTFLPLNFAHGSRITAGTFDGANIESNQNVSQVVDARSIGVDCAGIKDSAVALNALSDSGRITGMKLVFPAGSWGEQCLVKLSSTWRIYNSTSFTIDGGARCGLPGKCTHFKYTGSPGGAVVDMEQVQGFEIKNVFIDGNGIANTGVIVDQHSSGGIATYDGIFEGVLFDANASNSSGPHNGWVGLSVSPVSTVNVADIRVIDSAFECRNGTGTIGYGLGLTNGSRNALLEVIRHNYFEHCGYGIYQNNGGAIVEENTFGGDGSTIDDIYMTGTASHERIIANWSETQFSSSNQFLKAAFQDVTGEGIEISGNQIPVNGTSNGNGPGCALDVGGNTITSSEVNVWYPGYLKGKGGSKSCATTNGYSFTWSGPSGLSWPEDVTGTLTAGIFLPGSLKNGPSAGMIANSAESIAQGVPLKWTSATTVVETRAGDTGTGVVIGVSANAPGTSDRPTYVMTSGYIIMTADGDCSAGQFVTVSHQTPGRVHCTSSYAAGTVIGVVLLSKKSGGGVYVQIGLR